MKLAQVEPAPGAQKCAAPGERIVQFSFPDGTGGLISLRQFDNGITPAINVVEVYRTDGGVRVLAPDVQPQWPAPNAEEIKLFRHMSEAAAVQQFHRRMGGAFTIEQAKTLMRKADGL